MHAVQLPALVAAGLMIVAPAASAQEKEPAEEVSSASDHVLRSLLVRHADALETKDGRKLVAALKMMARHDNPELLAPATKALAYKATRVDRKAIKARAEEFGFKGKHGFDELLFEREAEVRAAAARLLANLPGKKSTKALVKALKDKQNQTERPAALAAIVNALGRLKHVDAEPLILGEYRRYRDKHISLACVRYFGQIKSSNTKVARLLAQELAAPEPPVIDSAVNPPASYWEARWETWQHVRRDVSWALKEITGQVFEPDDGTIKGDSKKALRYIKDHAQELGLK